MPKQRNPTFEECLALMRKRDANLQEQGFHALAPRAKEHVDSLIAAFNEEQDHGLRCWLLELIGEAKSERALSLLCDNARSDDEALRSWAIRGLQKLDTPSARKFLYDNRLA